MMKGLNQRLRHVPIQVHADIHVPLTMFHVIKNRHYVTFGPEVTGKAPKQFANIYIASVKKRIPEVGITSHTPRWVPFIVKMGEKFYPIESVTEHMFTRIGQTLGLQMAETALVVLRGQLRLVSRLFVQPPFVPHRTHQLMHGAEILAAYLDDDRPFVEEIVKHHKKLASSVVFVEDVFEAMRSLFPDAAKLLIQDLCKVLLFDAWTGCQDRHLYNWGIIRGTTRLSIPPRFSPIYDTARGLFWRHGDEQLRKEFLGKKGKSARDKFIRLAKPEIGVPDSNGVSTHIEMYAYLMKNADEEVRSWARTTFSDQNRTFVCEMIEAEFGRLFSSVRIQAIVELLSERHSRLSQFH